MTDKPPPHRWLVSGVGRSGTTALYEALQKVSHGLPETFDYVYEPYLWGEATWTSSRELAKGKFSTTDAINPWGLAAHLATPLFISKGEPGEHPLHDQFIARIFGGDGNTLAKLIRGCGRLNAFCRQVPDLKVIHIMRNPLDTINSVVGQFSFFGDEFFHSDRFRFFEETGAGDGASGDDLSDVQLAAQWWVAMNDAAKACARVFPDQVLVIAHEVFVHDPVAAMEQILAFLGLASAELDETEYREPVGPVTRKLNLKSEDVEFLTSATRTYFDEIRDLSLVAADFEVDERFAEVVQKYGAVDEGRYAPDVPRDTSPLSVRAILCNERNKNDERAERLIGIQNYLGRLLTEARWALRRSNRDIEQSRTEVAVDFDKLTRDPVLGYAQRVSKGLVKRLNRVESRITLLRSEPSISCVITSYNNGGLLRRAVNSVLSQGLVPKEIIIADDGSTGPSLELAEKIASEHEFVRLIHREQNLGPGGNRHEAILDASCPFVTTLDGDDEYAPRKIGAEWNAMNEKLDRVTFSRVYQILKGHRARVIAREFQDYQDFPQRRRLATIFDRSRYLPRDMMFSKQAYIESGGYETASEIYEDWSLKMRLANVIADWRYSKVTGTLYHKAPGGLSEVSGNAHVFWKMFALAKNAGWAIDALAPEQLREAVVRAVDLHEEDDFRQRFETASTVFQTRVGLRRFFGEYDGALRNRVWRGAGQSDMDDALTGMLGIIEKLAAGKKKTAKSQ